MSKTGPLISDKLCRLCLVDNKNVIHLFPPEVRTSRSPLLHLIRELLSITIRIEDDFPKRLCTGCVVKVQEFHRFICFARDNQEKLMSMYSCKQPIKNVPEEHHQTSDEETVDTPAPSHEVEQISRNKRQVERNIEKQKSKRSKIYSRTKKDSVSEVEEVREVVPEPHFVSVDYVKHETGEVVTTKFQIKDETTVDDPLTLDVVSKGRSGFQPVSVDDVKQEQSIEKDGDKNPDEAESEHKLVVRQLDAETWLQLHNIIQCRLKNKSTNLQPLSKFLFGQPYVVKWKCKLCLQFINAPTKNFDAHMIKVHKAVSRYPCEICGRYLEMKDYVLHWTEHYLIYKCTGCRRWFTNATKLRNHYDIVHSSFQYSVLCYICGVRFLLEEHFRKHLQMHENGDETASVPDKFIVQRESFTCEACNLKFKSDLRYFHHQRRCPALRESSDTETEGTSNVFDEPSMNGCMFFYCDECEEDISNEEDLKTHRKKHTLLENASSQMTRLPLSETVSECSEKAEETTGTLGENALLYCIGSYESQSLTDHQEHCATHAESQENSHLLCDICAYETCSISDFQIHLTFHVEVN